MCGNIITAGGNVISVNIEPVRNVTAMFRNVISAHHQHCLSRSVRTLELKRLPLMCPTSAGLSAAVTQHSDGLREHGG